MPQDRHRHEHEDTSPPTFDEASLSYDEASPPIFDEEPPTPRYDEEPPPPIYDEEFGAYDFVEGVLSLEGSDRKSTRLNSSHSGESRMPSSA